jgi:hypothetical protein
MVLKELSSKTHTFGLVVRKIDFGRIEYYIKLILVKIDLKIK